MKTLDFETEAEGSSEMTYENIAGPWKYNGQQWCNGLIINPLTPMSDQDGISPYNINTISTR